MEPVASHIKVKPKELVVSKIFDERIIIKSKYENYKTIIITNKRIVLTQFFSSEYFWIPNIKYIEYTPPNKSDFYYGGIIGYMKKRIFGRDITFYNNNNVKLFELKDIENVDKVFKAFGIAKTGLMKPEEYILLPKYENSSFINNAITFIGKIIGKNECKKNDSIYYSNNYYTAMPQTQLSNECFQNGKKCFELGEFEKSEIFFKKFCDIRPDLEDGYIFLAASLDNLKRLEESIITYDKALKINKENINTIKMQA